MRRDATTRESSRNPTVTGDSPWLRDALRAVADAREADTRQQLETVLDRVEGALRAAHARSGHDPETGLPDRASFVAALRAFLAECRRHRRQGALVVLQVTEPAGDGGRLSSSIGAVLAARVRTEDVIGRLGATQFGILLREAGTEDAAAFAAEARRRLHGVCVETGLAAEISAATLRINAETEDASTALLAADIALHTARTAGGNRTEVADIDGLPRFTVEGQRERRILKTLGGEARAPSLEGALQSVRDLLGMEIAYVTRHTDDQQVLLHLRGDGQSFGVRVDSRLPLAETYCQAILEGELPPLIPDVLDEPVAAKMAVTSAAGVRAYASVPILMSDGQFYGTLCCASHEPQPQLGSRDLEFLHVLARLVAHEIEHDAYLREQHELRVQATGTSALVQAVQARDAYTGEHSRVVVELAVRVAERLGLDRRTVQEVAQVALLHDIGKIAVPDAILLKTGPLTPAEQVEMRRHPEHGEGLVRSVIELAHLGAAIRAEHESYDGSGYPDGLRGEDIPIASRITLVCDALHAMTSDRPYRSAMPRAQAIQELTGNAGAQFCPTCVDGLLAVLASRDADL